jgi:hypothetical protein
MSVSYLAVRMLLCRRVLMRVTANGLATAGVSEAEEPSRADLDHKLISIW